MTSRFPIVWFVLALVVTTDGPSRAGSQNPDHRLMVYSVQTYGTYIDDCDANTKTWKSDIFLQSSQDPYVDFWNYIMLNCHTDACAHSSSLRRLNSEVTTTSMAGADGWHDADMVFFFGHNTMIQPQWSHSFKIWHHESYGYYDEWCADTVDWIDWGTPAEPYTYHRHEVDDAAVDNAYAVYYGYQPFTSILIGQDFVEGTWLNEETWNQVLPDVYQGALGAGDTEWIIGHGCNTATVAMYENGQTTDPIVPTELGVSAWSRSWDRLHMVLGHYYSTTTTLEPHLAQFALDLRNGDVIRDAYFDVHNAGYLSDPVMGMPSAISLSPNGCCAMTENGLECPAAGCQLMPTYMEDETWTQPHGAPTTPVDQHYYYVTSWQEFE